MADRKRTVSQVRQAARAVLDAVPASIAVLDADGVIVDVNEQWRAFARENGGDLDAVSPGVNYLAACRVDGEDGEVARLCREGVRRVIEGQQGLFEYEYPCHSPDENRWYLVRAAPMEPPGSGAVVAHIDVTTRRESMNALERAKEEAEAATQLKASLLANMSHELRTPLTSIIGFSEVLGEELEGPHAQFADRIYQSSRRLMRTLDSVLQFSKLDAGTYEPEPDTVPLCITVQQCVAAHRADAQKAGVRLHLSLPPQPVVGRLDETAVYRILANLVENAIKFTGTGGRVAVALRQEETDAVLTVADTGVGMSPSFLPHALEPFRQESTGLQRTYEGSGLGLAITHHLVSALGGTIEIESKEGSGTECTVRLPL